MRRLLGIAVALIAAWLLPPAARAQSDAAHPADAPRPSFAEFLAGIRTEALSRGIRPEILDEALAHIDDPSPGAMQRDRTQAETVLSLDEYVEQRVTSRSVAAGRDMLARHHELLD